MGSVIPTKTLDDVKKWDSQAKHIVERTHVYYLFAANLIEAFWLKKKNRKVTVIITYTNAPPRSFTGHANSNVRQIDKHHVWHLRHI